MAVGQFTDKLPEQVTKSLEGVSFPAEKQEVVKQAQANQADGKIVTALQKIPEGVYNSVNDVASKVGLG